MNNMYGVIGKVAKFTWLNVDKGVAHGLFTVELAMHVKAEFTTASAYIKTKILKA